MIKEIFAVSDRVKPRTIPEVMLKLQEECGELATEVGIQVGFLHKTPGNDGVLGESIDAIICLIDVIRLAYGNSVTPLMIETKLAEKLAKWEFNDSVRPLQ